MQKWIFLFKKRKAKKILIENKQKKIFFLRQLKNIISILNILKIQTVSEKKNLEFSALESPTHTSTRRVCLYRKEKHFLFYFITSEIFLLCVFRKKNSLSVSFRTAAISLTYSIKQRPSFVASFCFFVAQIRYVLVIECVGCVGTKRKIFVWHAMFWQFFVGLWLNFYLIFSSIRFFLIFFKLTKFKFCKF